MIIIVVAATAREAVEEAEGLIKVIEEILSPHQ